MEVKGHIGLNIENYVPWLQNLVKRSVMTMMTCTEVKGQQRSNVLSMLYGYHIWSDIPQIQGKDHDDIHEGHPKVIKGLMLIMPYGFQICQKNHWIKLGTIYVLNRGQMLTEVKCSKVCFAIGSLGLKHHQAIKMVTALKRMLPPNLARALAKGTVMSCFIFYFFKSKSKLHRIIVWLSLSKGANMSALPTLPKKSLITSFKAVSKCKQVDNNNLKDIFERSKFSKKKKLVLEFWKLGVVYFCSVKTFFSVFKN